MKDKGEATAQWEMEGKESFLADFQQFMKHKWHFRGTGQQENMTRCHSTKYQWKAHKMGRKLGGRLPASAVSLTSSVTSEKSLNLSRPHLL